MEMTSRQENVRPNRSNMGALSLATHTMQASSANLVTKASTRPRWRARA